MRAGVLALSIALAGASCAPTIDGPVETQRAVDDRDSARLARQLAELPGAVRADVTLRRSVVDPFTAAASPASAAVLVVVDPRADRAEVTRAASALVRGVVPDVSAPAIVVEVAPAPVTSRPPIAPLAIVFGAIAMIAAWLAWRERWRVLSAD